MDTPAIVAALEKGGLCPGAAHIVQVDTARALTKVGIGFCSNSKATSQLPAHDLGVLQVPAVSADSAPAPRMGNLYAPLAPVSAVHQAQGGTWKGGDRENVGKALGLPPSPVFPSLCSPMEKIEAHPLSH